MIRSVAADRLLGLLDQANVNLVAKGINEEHKEYYALCSAEVNKNIGKKRKV